MKPADFIVRIPEPCHEDWNSMKPDAKGKFCSSCSKSVFDFTNKTDAEIKDILIEHKNEKVCGHFKKTQIDRPLTMTLDPGNLPKNISVTKTFALALFIVFGSLLFSCKDEKGNEIPLTGMPEMVAGLTFTDIPPPVMDSCSITGEIPLDSTKAVYMTQDVVNGGIGYPDVEAPPIDPAPTPTVVDIEYATVGMIAYSIDSANVVPIDSALQSGKGNGNEPGTINANVFTLFPNPSSGEFTIKYDLLKRTDVKINIFNMNGSLVKSVVNVAAQYEGQYRVPVSLGELSNGIYIVSMIHNGTQSTERLVIAR